jgi:hypothetical protein
MANENQRKKKLVKKERDSVATCPKPKFKNKEKFP